MNRSIPLLLAALAVAGGAFAEEKASTGLAMQEPHTGAMTYDAAQPRIPTAAISVEDAALLWRLYSQGVPVRVDDVSSYTTVANAESVGLGPSRVVVADNTGIARKRVGPYLEHVRDSGGRYASREYDFGDDAMEVSVLRESPRR